MKYGLFGIGSGICADPGIAVRITQAAEGETLLVVAGAGVATSSVTVQRIAGGMSAYVVSASLVFILLVVLRQQHVTGDTLFGAFAAYLAAAVIFAMIMSLLCF